MSRIERGIARTWTGSALLLLLAVLIASGTISKHEGAPWTIRAIPTALCAIAGILGIVHARRMRIRGPRRRRETEAASDQWHTLSCFALMTTALIGNGGLPVLGMMLIILRWNRRRES